MEKYSQLCINYEKTLLENCRKLKSENVDCILLEDLYKDCLKFKHKKEKTTENIKISHTEIIDIIILSSNR